MCELYLASGLKYSVASGVEFIVWLDGRTSATPQTKLNIYCSRNYSLASRLNGYMYSNGKSLNVALFILMANHLAWCNLA